MAVRVREGWPRREKAGDEPFMQRMLHLFEFAGEEVVGTGDDDESFRLGCRCDYLLKRFGWAIFIRAAADEEFGQGAGREETVVVASTLGSYRQTQRGEAGNTRVEPQHVRRVTYAPKEKPTTSTGSP